MQVTSFSTHLVYSFSSYNVHTAFIDLITCIFHSIIKNEETMFLKYLMMHTRLHDQRFNFFFKVLYEDN